MADILLIISGSVAAYKSLDLIRRLREREHAVRCILTKGGAEFITPLQVSSLSGSETYSDLFSLKDEVEMGHIRLSREADLIVVAPASADLLAKMAGGHASDLATACLLASDKPVLVAPAMNAQMWRHKATQRNLARLSEDGVTVIAPESGELACGETGDGRLASTESILAAIDKLTPPASGGSRRAMRDGGGQPGIAPLPTSPRQRGEEHLRGYRALVTAGPTFEPLDPVRFLGNRSSGRQGYAIAVALAAAGAEVTLVSGPTALPDPMGCRTIRVETAEQMWQAAQDALPADIAVCTAAVADWRPAQAAGQKMKKRGSGEAPAIALAENPDILAGLAKHGMRPRLLVGFAAETEKLEEHAAAKLRAKGCDWIVANEVGAGKVFGQDRTSALLMDQSGVVERWEDASKAALAESLARRIAAALTDNNMKLVKPA